MTYYNRTLDDVMYLCGDNCNVNRKISNDLGIPLIGCHSHRLNLAVQQYLGLKNDADDGGADNRTIEQKERSRLRDNFSALMSKLKTIKGKAKLEDISDYVALKANATRWSGNFRMVNRFFQFDDDLQEYVSDATEAGPLQTQIAELIPNAADIIALKPLAAALTNFHSVSLQLQKKDGDINFLQARLMFDRLI